MSCGDHSASHLFVHAADKPSDSALCKSVKRRKRESAQKSTEKKQNIASHKNTKYNICPQYPLVHNVVVSGSLLPFFVVVVFAVFVGKDSEPLIRRCEYNKRRNIVSRWYGTHIVCLFLPVCEKIIKCQANPSSDKLPAVRLFIIGQKLVQGEQLKLRWFLQQIVQ